jgi:predicted nucleic acid-binding protein
MTLLIDASPIVSLTEKTEPRRHLVQDVLRSYSGRLVIPAPVTAEIDYMLEARNGIGANLGFLDDLAAGRFEVECLLPAKYGIVAALQRRYAALSPGLADLSVVVLAQRLNTRRVLTFDARHFRAIVPLQGGQFEILPGPGEPQT